MALARFRGLVWGMQGLAASTGPMVGAALSVITPRLTYLCAAVASVRPAPAPHPGSLALALALP